MNKKLQELLTETDVWCDQHWFGSTYYNQAWEQRFAELLIKECSVVADTYIHESITGKVNPLEITIYEAMLSYFELKDDTTN